MENLSEDLATLLEDEVLGNPKEKDDTNMEDSGSSQPRRLSINVGITKQQNTPKADFTFPSPLTTPQLVKQQFMSFPSPPVFSPATELKYEFKTLSEDRAHNDVKMENANAHAANGGINLANHPCMPKAVPLKVGSSPLGKPPPPPSISPVATSKPVRRRRRASTSSVNNKESRWKSWTREEEIFLVGAVMDRFFKRGSLSSTQQDNAGKDDCWSYIKQKYDLAWKNYQTRTMKSIPPERSMNALSRHYKVMKARISQADMNGVNEEDDFRTFFDEWEQMYNIDNCLLGTPRANTPTGFSKRKVRLSYHGNFRAWEGPRRTSVLSTCTVDSTSTSGSFMGENGYAKRMEIPAEREDYF